MGALHARRRKTRHLVKAIQVKTGRREGAGEIPGAGEAEDRGWAKSLVGECRSTTGVRERNVLCARGISLYRGQDI